MRRDAVRRQWIRGDASAVAAAALVARLAYLLLIPGAANADDATTALMAERILAGHRYVFFAGQDYMGAAEQYLQALAVALLPDPAAPDMVIAVRLVDVLISTGVAVGAYLLGREVYGERVRALVAGFAFAAGPAFTLHFGTRSLGGYVLAQFAGVVALLLAFRLRGRAWRAAGLGAAVGAVLYESPTALCLAGPALLWAVPDLRVRRRLRAAFGAGLLVALAPALGWAFAHQRVPGLPAHQPPSTALDRLGNVLGPIARELLGLTGSQDMPLVPGARAVVAALGAAWLLAAWRRRHGLVALVTGRAGRRRRLDAVLLTVPAAIVLHVIAPSAWYAGTPRYAFAVAPAVAVLLAGLVPHGRSVPVRPGRVVPAALLVAAVVALSAVGVPRHRGSIAEADVERMADALAARRVAVVRAGYWTAVPLALAARGRFRVVQVEGIQRFPELRAAALDREGVDVARAGQPPPHDGTTGPPTWSCGPFRVWQGPGPRERRGERGAGGSGAREGTRTPTPEGTGT